jgi:hypothetical protein
MPPEINRHLGMGQTLGSLVASDFATASFCHVLPMRSFLVFLQSLNVVISLSVAQGFFPVELAKHPILGAEPW